jgi:hypothetical protein
MAALYSRVDRNFSENGMKYGENCQIEKLKRLFITPLKIGEKLIGAA